MKISFWGSSEFSLEILKELHRKHKEEMLELSFVVSQPAKPFGRKKELKHNPVAQYCLDNEISLLVPNKVAELFEPETVQKYFASSFTRESLQTDLAVVAAYGKILPQKILETAQYGFINFHGSVLPKYRGAIPVQLTIMNQDATGGITVIKMDKGMDTGDVITTYEMPIERNTTGGELMAQLAEVSAKMIDRNFDLIFNPANWNLQKQDDTKATLCYVSDFTKEKLEVLFEDGVKQAHGKIMAANPEPKAWLCIGEKKYNVIRSFLNENTDLRKENNSQNAQELSVFSDDTKTRLYLALHDGCLEIKEIQPEGKSVMDARSFINGYLR